MMLSYVVGGGGVQVSDYCARIYHIYITIEYVKVHLHTVTFHDSKTYPQWHYTADSNLKPTS